MFMTTFLACMAKTIPPRLENRIGKDFAEAIVKDISYEIAVREQRSKEPVSEEVRDNIQDFLLSSNSLPNFSLMFGVTRTNLTKLGSAEIIPLYISNHFISKRLYINWYSVFGTRAPFGVTLVRHPIKVSTSMSSKS